MQRTMPNVSVRPDVVSLTGSLDYISSSMQAPPGAVRGAINYEPVFGGGYQTLGGIERFSGQPSPSAATYLILPAAVPGVYPQPGSTVTGAASNASALVIVTKSTFIVVTKVMGAFAPSEVLTVSGLAVGTFGSAFAYPPITPDLDNSWSALAAAAYASDIAAVPGSGSIRGLAILSSSVYAWRNTAAGTAMAIYKSSPTGWQLVPLLTEIGFNAGSVAPAEGAAVSKGGVSATVKRVVLESGSWSAGTAAGRLITTTPSGTFTAGAITGGGTLTLAASLPGSVVQAQITLSPNGRIQTDAGNFTASTQTRRLYGCDGVNREFEFDGDVLVPITTGMNARANAVKVHKNHLFFCFNGSIQCSGIGQPYAWTPIFGAAEIGTGDVGTGFVTVAGSESQSALMVFCRDSTFVLYGNSSADWNLIPISTQRGALPYSATEFAGSPFAYDAPGFVAFSATQAFGNYGSEVVSRIIEAITRSKTPLVSVVVKPLARYRCFFSDGTAVVATPSGNGGYRWATISYGKNITAAVADEIGSVSRTFYGDDQGMVFEADVGRSIDGAPIACYLKLAALSQGSPVTEKTYRGAWVETKSSGAFTLRAIGEFDDSDPMVDPSLEQAQTVYGSGGVWDTSNWDSAFFDAKQYDRRMFDFLGTGYNIAPVFSSVSDSQLPHEIATITLLYSPRKMVR